MKIELSLTYCVCSCTMLLSCEQTEKKAPYNILSGKGDTIISGYYDSSGNKFGTWDYYDENNKRIKQVRFFKTLDSTTAHFAVFYFDQLCDTLIREEFIGKQLISRHFYKPSLGDKTGVTGEDIFSKWCSSCHAFEMDMTAKKFIKIISGTTLDSIANDGKNFHELIKSKISNDQKDSLLIYLNKQIRRTH